MELVLSVVDVCSLVCFLLVWVLSLAELVVTSVVVDDFRWYLDVVALFVLEIFVEVVPVSHRQILFSSVTLKFGKGDKILGLYAKGQLRSSKSVSDDLHGIPELAELLQVCKVCLKNLDPAIITDSSVVHVHSSDRCCFRAGPSRDSALRLGLGFRMMHETFAAMVDLLH